ncbi:MAG: DUF1080 domain-containing protein [Verrucomicrobiales bacterium]|nr:DUF1080 domain-containing protein [Verrucomicrobiales bacterium]
MRWKTLQPILLSAAFTAATALLGSGCAECTQVILGKGDLSNVRPPTGAWKAAGDVKLNPTDPSRFEILPGTGVIVNGPDGKTVDILTTAEYGDLRVSYDFCIPKGSNSGVYFMGRYEVQIFDSYGATDLKHSDCGGIYERWENDRGFEGHPPRSNACKAPGEWQHFEVVFRAPRFDPSGRKVENARFKRVVLNGITIHENVEVTGPTRAAHFSDEQTHGPLMAQGDHGPIAFRNIRITPLHLP